MLLMGQGMVLEEKVVSTPVCSVCNCEIEESIHRILIMQDKDKNPVVKRFHFFFPCWDLDYLAQNYADYKIVKGGFSCDYSLKDNTKLIKSLQKNQSFWE